MYVALDMITSMHTNTEQPLSTLCSPMLPFPLYSEAGSQQTNSRHSQRYQSVSGSSCQEVQVVTGVLPTPLPP